ncbi:MAG: hypothetical protein H6Q19_930 [Bacteroidetes bacterium]|nr:hypothetical protein [Bacteroidota bacterium]
MEDLGDYIYLILLLLAGISGIFKKKGTNNETLEKKKPVINLPKSWEEFEQQSTTQTQKTIARPEPTRTIISPARTVVPEAVSGETIPRGFETGSFQTYDAVDDISKMRAKKTVTKNIKSQTNNPEPEISEEEINPLYSLNNAESARAAFIYSEIFNRKYH